METKALYVIEIHKGKNTYCFTASVGAPFGEARDSLIEMFDKIVNDMNQSDKKTQEKMKELQSQEVVKEN